MPLYACAALIQDQKTETLVSGGVLADTEQEAEAHFFGKIRADLPGYEIVRILSNAIPADMIRSVVEVEGV